MTRSSLLLLSFLFFLNDLDAQSLSGSAYNILGIGSLEQPGLVAYQGMGRAGIGSRSQENVNLKNPAALNAIAGYTQIFDLGIYYSGLSQQLGSQSFNSNEAGINGFNYWFKANPKLGIVFGTSKFSDASYDITDTNVLSPTLGSYTARNIGEGGLNQVYFGAGYEAIKGFNVGLKLDFLFGSLNNTTYITEADISSNLTIEDKNRFIKPVLELGAQYSYNIGKAKDITFGLVYRPQASTSINSENIIYDSAEDTISSEYSGSMILPSKLGVGLGTSLGSWKFNVDFELEKWSINENPDDFSYDDRIIFSFGAEYQKDPFSDNFLDRMSYRFGTGFQTSYVMVDETAFNYNSVSFGLGLPINQKGAINISYEYLTNDANGTDLILEQSSTFSIGFSFKDLWFRKGVYR